MALGCGSSIDTTAKLIFDRFYHFYICGLKYEKKHLIDNEYAVGNQWKLQATFFKVGK